MESPIWVAILYAQSIALPTTLFISRLAVFRREKLGAKIHRARRVLNAIWWLQAILSLSFLASSVLTTLAAIRKVQHATTWPILQAHITSYIGLSLYFAAGLLPDPNTLFKPTNSNAHTWILAGVLEGASLLDAVTARATILYTCYAWLSGVQLLITIAMLTLYIVPAVAVVHTSGTDAERAVLFGNENDDSQRATSRLALATADAQSTNWLDYLVGFSVLLPYIWPWGSRRYQAMILFCFGLLVAQRVINVLVPLQLGSVVESLGEGSIPYSPIALYCFYRFLQGYQGVLYSARAIFWIRISQLLFRNLTCDAFEHVLMLSLDFHLSERIGEVMAALNKGGSINTFLDGFAFQVFPMIFDLGVAAVYLFLFFDAFYSIIVLGVMWSYIFVTIYMAKYRGRAKREMVKRDREMDAAKTDALMAYETVHHYGAVGSEVSRFHSLVEKFQHSEYFVLLSLNGLNIIQNTIFVFGVVLVCVLSAHQISIGVLRVSDFVALVTYFAQLQAPLAFFGSFYNQMQNNLVDAERMLELFQHRSDVVDGPNAQPLLHYEGDIEFENVTFHYAAGKMALRNVSFSIRAGTTTAIVGESGSGKSTILKLLFHFYNVDKGRILIDGNDIRNITMESLRSHIGVVPQDTVLFNDSILYNLRYGRPEASDAEIYRACVAASIHERILGFPDGYETRVGERGLKLSGGERQRISITRAILKRPKIMLLDEATASLDTQTERQIQDALEVATSGRTTIVIAHRLSTIIGADQIIVLRDGTITERGTHEELLRMNGEYRMMLDKQSLAERRE